MKRVLSLVLSLILLLSLVPTAAYAHSPAYGEEMWLRDTTLHRETVLSDNIYWSDYYQQPRHERFVTYTPNRDVSPKVIYGESVCGRITAGDAAAALESEGYRTVAAINGDFYDTATGAPLGILISDGELLSGSGEYYALGFLRDGSAVMGQPSLRVTLSTDSRDRFHRSDRFGEDTLLTMAGINKPRADYGGAVLLTYDFRTDHTTGTSTAGLTVLTRIRRGTAAIGGELELEVLDLIRDSAPLELRPDEAAITISDLSSYEDIAVLDALGRGDRLTVRFTTDDPIWEDVTEAIGALHLLVENGRPLDAFKAGYAPRTAVGLKADGSVILYTVDGRQPDRSIGASMKVLAQRMAELGCVTALCLDGGGSTTMVASMPHSYQAELINRPSDKTQRKVSNLLALVSDGRSTGRSDHIYLAAEAPAVLAGQTMRVSAALVDTGYFPMGQPDTIYASDGFVENGIFYAPLWGGPVTITAESGRISESITVMVVSDPDVVTVRRDGVPVTELTLVPGETAELDLSAIYHHIPLQLDKNAMLWSLDPALGTIDGGILKTNYTEGTGTISVSLGDRSLSIPLTLDGRSPFADTEGHWASAYMAALYHRGVLTGEDVDGELYAHPEAGVTRAEFAVFLSRYLGINSEDYAGMETPFADIGTVDAWAANEARAMYALGIVNGVDNGSGVVHFAPASVLTRAQAMTMLLRIREEGPISGDLSVFTDRDQVQEWSREAFETMVSLGVVGGSYGRLDPNAPMTRGAVCKVLATLPR